MSCASAWSRAGALLCSSTNPTDPESRDVPVPALGTAAAGLWVLGKLDVGKQLLAQNLNS